MSCEQNSSKVGRAAGQSGISPAASKRGYTSGSTAQASFFARAGQARRKRSQKKKNTGGRGPQVSFFEQNQASGSSKQRQDLTKSLPTQRQIYLSRDFTSAELDRLIVKFHLAAAATARHVSELDRAQTRGIGYSDPRPLDWARSDQQQYDFLIDQLRRARRGHGYIDTKSLKRSELVELWEFASFEADRAHRNIDHLTGGLSHLKGATAAYLVKGHRLEARFYTFLAGQLETIIPPEILARQSRELQFEEGANH